MTRSSRCGATLLILGSGSLARALCYSLPFILPGANRIVVIARSEARLRDMAFVSTMQAAAAGSSCAFTFECVDLERGELGSVLDAIQPDLVVNCASYHSPWEHLCRPSGWTQLLQRVEFGITLPLQAPLAIRIATAIAAARRPPLFVNACYPDAVNRVLHLLQLPVLCGVGNITVLAASCCRALGLDRAPRLRMLAHHLHLHRPRPGVSEARVWVDGAPVADVEGLLHHQRTTDRLEVNKVIGCTASLLLRQILDGQPGDAHVPGPLGLAGGYPVRLCGAEVHLNLPAGCSVEEAVRWNDAAACADGVTVDADGAVRFTQAARAALTELLPDIAEGFHVSEMTRAAHLMLSLREELRARPHV